MGVFPKSFYIFAGERALADINTLWFPDRTIKAGIKFVSGRDEIGFPRHFGRDMCIFALQTMHIWPESTKAILAFLFKHQGIKFDSVTEEEPGKIFHEHEENRRHPKNWPDTVYFALDSTPLALIVLAHYYEQTRDEDFVKQYWPNVLSALNWIDNYGDRDGDGFVEYHRINDKGLTNQAWKDSHNSYCHVNGEPAQTPIAPVEIQGWVYLAKILCADLADGVIGDFEKAISLRSEADTLKRNFNDVFWVRKRRFLAQGLDADKNQIKTITSNAGQVLFSGIVDPEKAEHVVKRLMKPDVFTPWGLRTLSTHEKSYDPDSYHNGSIWPFDNWVCSKGFERYGFINEALRVRNSIFCATADLGHNPELYVVKDRGHIFTLHRYVRFIVDEDELEQTRREQAAACIIQAWSAGATLNWLTASPNNILRKDELEL